MLYSDRVAITGNTSNDTDSATADITLNGQAKRILYVWSVVTDQTATAAEGKIESVFATGDIDRGGSPRPLIPVTAGVGSFLGSVAPNDFVPATFHPVDWGTAPNGVITLGVRGLGGAVGSVLDIGLVYSDGEGHPPPSAWMGRGLRAPPTWVLGTDLTAITNSTTETALASITVPGNARECVGLACMGVSDGVQVTAEEFNTRVRWTATGANVKQFEPAQIWPTSWNANAGLSTTIDRGVAPSPPEYMPLRFGVTKNSSLTARVTFRTAVTNAANFYSWAAFI